MRRICTSCVRSFTDLAVICMGRYAFGYGLSYASFSYSDMTVKVGSSPGDFTVCATVKNTADKSLGVEEASLITFFLVVSRRILTLTGVTSLCVCCDGHFRWFKSTLYLPATSQKWHQRECWWGFSEQLRSPVEPSPKCTKCRAFCVAERVCGKPGEKGSLGTVLVQVYRRGREDAGIGSKRRVNETGA